MDETNISRREASDTSRSSSSQVIDSLLSNKRMQLTALQV
jgi:hypothetical protein